MKLNKCCVCNKMSYCPIHITEIDNGKVLLKDMCAQCGENYMRELDEPNKCIKKSHKQIVDLSHISTPEELLDFLSDHAADLNKSDCECGLSHYEFEQSGRFGCPKCYTHFKEEIEKQVLPFHKSGSHHGKRPRYHFLESLMQDPVEKMKVLKLRYAKALELEQYEKAAEIKKEIETLNSGQPQ